MAVARAANAQKDLMCPTLLIMRLQYKAPTVEPIKYEVKINPVVRVENPSMLNLKLKNVASNPSPITNSNAAI